MKYPGLQKQPIGSHNNGWPVQIIRRFLRTQFGRPKGLFGNLVGKIMARTPSNVERMHWTLSLLDLQPADRLLEIGFGPGFAIKQAATLAAAGFVAGIDHSDVMVRQASKRNAAVIREGRVDLRLGSVSCLPTFSEPFDKIFTINSIHFWQEPVSCLRQLRGLLRPGGLIAVTLQPRSRTATDAITREIGDEIAEKLSQAGFSNVRLEVKQMKPLAAACALGIHLPDKSTIKSAPESQPKPSKESKQ